MNSLQILIVEDEILIAMMLRNALEKNGYNVTAMARTLTDARESVLVNPPDLAVIDITLDGAEGNGVETAKELSDLHPMPIIYLTANSDLDQFLEAQQTRPSAYMLKPFKEDELLFNIELAYHNFISTIQHPRFEGHMMLPVKQGLEMVVLDNVMYLKAGGAYAEVVMANGTRHLVSTGLGQLEHYFKKDFFRLSRSYVINLRHIKRIKENELLLSDELTLLPIPDAHRKELLNRLTVVRTKPSTKK
ncbi:response regulator [Dyadobacter chenwenxiniae]|uniref:Response regulator n=1 Tax=Dyadobacter chenwenxiniae TaxID=2906456 RepID=A0A9X1PRS8_9BACT|nr:response regulator [Dyadobacter chenwenxiniae]MCF0065813.1 response regulator [Dyadobacter chenwenxiniae]UON84033.1 response regulator [Dyadobacter chenwenxiniae]